MISFDNHVKQAYASRAPLRQQIVEYMTQHRIALGSFQLALEIEAFTALQVQRAVMDLIVDGKLVSVGTGWDDRPLYRLVEIGACDWCALVDHHLVAGECPSCIERRAKVAEQLS